MAQYVIGDIHGCFDDFQRLLELIEFDAVTDTVWHTGDLVNGGPQSLAVLKWFFDHRREATTILGNHDLHLIAVVRGAHKKSHRDNFDDVLNADECDELIDWLRAQPLLVPFDKRVLVHAGLLPEWTVEDAVEAAREVEEILSSSRPEQVLGVMYGNRPARLSDAATVEERWRVTINALTRMRALTEQGKMDFTYKSTYEELPEDRKAWFDVENAAWTDRQVVCGHWSALGFRQSERVIALDSGCRWGGKLTALRLGDDQVFQVDSSVVPPARFH